MISKKLKPYQIVSFTFLILFAIYTIAPLYLLFVNSFKSKFEILSSPFSFPINGSLVYIISAFNKIHYLRALLVTFLVTLFSIILIIVVSSVAAWTLVRNRKRKSSKIIYLVFIAAMLIPFQAVMYPLLDIFYKIYLQNIFGLVIMYGGFGLSMSMFLYYGFIKSIPHEVEEAALIDGASILQIFTKITFPQLIGTTTTVIILNAMWIWNDYLLPFLTLDSKSSLKTLTLELYYGKITTSQYGNPLEFIFPSVLLSIIPIIIVFFSLQKQFVEGASQGAVKG